jgi:hypothetical protein
MTPEERINLPLNKWFERADRRVHVTHVHLNEYEVALAKGDAWGWVYKRRVVPSFKRHHWSTFKSYTDIADRQQLFLPFKDCPTLKDVVNVLCVMARMDAL